MTHYADGEKVPEYLGMYVGGVAASTVGGLALPIILTVGLVSTYKVPVGLAALAVGAAIIGTILLVGRMLVRREDETKADVAEHRAEHQAVAFDAEDIATIRKQTANTAAIVAKWDLEHRDEHKPDSQAEEFRVWRAAAEKRFAVLEGDNVTDLQTVRDLKALNERHRGEQDQ